MNTTSKVYPSSSNGDDGTVTFNIASKASVEDEVGVDALIQKIWHNYLEPTIARGISVKNEDVVHFFGGHHNA